ncbi:RNA polymerase sigma factor [Paenibacillus hodogayensis]|uniref:RNA polymerase sigma factor n=1 Tax=Paenibacillus hodogayensis TaxID=279208 RepID=A0ABV5VR67_9BACL
MRTGLTGLHTDAERKDEQDALLMDVYKQMFIVTYSIMRNKTEAMDAVQESWVKILRKLDTLRDRDKLIQWAKVIATNTAYNMIKRKVAVSLGEAEESGIPLISTEGVEERVMRNIIFEEINKLDDKTRQILTYKFYYDLKDKEIAERMELPLGTVKARIHRGKEQLRAMLTDPYLKPD